MRPARPVLFLPAAAFAAGIWVASSLYPDRGPLAFGFAALCLLWSLSRGAWLRALASTAVMLTAGALIADLHRPEQTPELDSENGEVLLLAGCIVEPVASDDIQSRFVLELEPGARARVTLTTREGEALPRLSYGQTVEVEARVRKPKNFRNPGGFDYVRYLTRQQVYWTAAARGVASLRALDRPCGSVFRRQALAVRDAVTARVHELYPRDAYMRQMLPALLTGDDSQTERQTTEDYRRTGTYHALVVSGLHITVVAGSVLVLMRHAGAPLGVALLVPAVIAWLYAGVVNWQPPVVRSAAGFTLFLMARWVFREGCVLNLLAAVALAILAFDPDALYDASFQLTFLSVAAIGGLAAPAMGRTVGPYAGGVRLLGKVSADHSLEPLVRQWRIEMRLLIETAALVLHIPRRGLLVAVMIALRLAFLLIESVMLSAAVQLALAVPMVLYFHLFSLTGLAANLVVSLALTVAVPCGLLACLSGWGWLVWLTASLVHFARWSASFWAGLEPGFRIPDPPAWLAVVCVACVTVFAVALLTAEHRRWIVATAVLCCAVTAVLLIGPFVPELTGELEMTTIDVGQGDSILVASPERRTLLVDAGGIAVFDERTRPRLDIGEDVVSPYLWRRGLKRLDGVAITHFHADHAGGMVRVIRNFRPAELWVGGVVDDPLWRSVWSAARDSGTRIRHLRQGDRVALGSMPMRVLGPLRGAAPGARAGNNDSLILLAEHGRHRFLLTGDAEERVESELVRSGVLPEVDVLKVAHHGSRTSTQDELVDVTRPLFATISSGSDNPYGHPHPLTLRRLRAAGCRIFRTDERGLISIRSDGARLTISTPAL